MTDATSRQQEPGGSEAGFTLVEVLVTLAVVALLVSIGEDAGQPAAR